MKRLYKALVHSIHGIYFAWKEEAAFRQEILLAIILIPTAFFLAPDKLSLILMISSVLFVLIVELLNTAIEAVVDKIGLEIHILSKKAKDVASAAVFVALVNMALIWGIILCL